MVVLASGVLIQVGRLSPTDLCFLFVMDASDVRVHQIWAMCVVYSLINTVSRVDYYCLFVVCVTLKVE